MRFALTLPTLTALTLALAGCDMATKMPFFGQQSGDSAVATTSDDPIDQAFADPPASLAPAVGEAAAPAPQPALNGVEYVASRVRTGDFLCAGSAIVNVSAAPDSASEFVVRARNFDHRLVPVETASGAVRLEDQANGIVWLQVRERAMLMNQTKGQRLAAECVHQ